MLTNPSASIVLKPKREKSLLNRHPWVFSGAIARTDGTPGPGHTVDVLAADGRWLARGVFSPRSQIRCRVWTFDADCRIDAGLIRDRLQQALALRRALLDPSEAEACRLVNGESDGLPGLILDRYGPWVVCQFLSAGTERWKAVIVDLLADLFPGLTGIYERSDVDVRRKEGLPPVAGSLTGEAPPDRIEIIENGCRFQVDIQRGHKTGFYLDQRDNRAWVARYARGVDMLNCFAYTGGFAVPALKAGATHVINVDASAEALDLAGGNLERNGIDPARWDCVTGDVFKLLRRYAGEGRTFDRIVLDPPKFVKTKGDLMRASRGYKDINRLAFHLLRPGGMLFTFSCSGLMGHDLFQKIVADAALDAGVHARIVHWLNQSADHPAALNFPEGSYLKGLVCRVP